MNECKPLGTGKSTLGGPGGAGPLSSTQMMRDSLPVISAQGRTTGRGLHSSTFQLNLSALYGVGGAGRGCVARVEGVFRVCEVFSCDRHDSS